MKYLKKYNEGSELEVHRTDHISGDPFNAIIIYVKLAQEALEKNENDKADGLLVSAKLTIQEVKEIIYQSKGRKIEFE